MATTKTKIPAQIKNPLFDSVTKNFINKKISKRTLIIIIVVGLLLLAYFKKSWFVAATVNNQPIISIELEQKLNQQYRTQVLNQLINEKIIEQEATKKGVIISPRAISDKIDETEKRYGGSENFNMLLSQQGANKDDFVKQIKLQLMVEKMYSSEIQPTEDEIKQFMEANKNDPEATDEAKFKQTATVAVKQQKLSTVFQTKFQELKTATKVQIF